MEKRVYSIAKIIQPSSDVLLPRKRLFTLLDNARSFPVIYVSSPPGSGKTSLITSYLNTRKLPCIWYQVDEGDADIATFFYYMSMAAKKAATEKKKPLPIFTAEHVTGNNIFALRYFEDLYSRLKPPFAIVFDNYQQIPASSDFHEMMRCVFDAVPGGLNVFLLSRKQMPQQFIRLRANNMIYFLGWDDIRFTLEETKRLMQIGRRIPISDDTLNHVHEKMTGWAAGLVLVNKCMKMNDIDYRYIDKLAPVELFEYFANEIFEKLERNIQDFLLKTSFLNIITTNIAREITGLKNAGDILSRLNSENYFTDKRLVPEITYQYHPLFREFLIARAGTTFSQGHLSKIKQKAAELLRDSGQIEDAAQLFLDLKDFRDISYIICNFANSLIGQGRLKTLSEWLKFLPEEILQNDPWLLYWKGICHLPFNQAESKSNFEKAFEKFRKHKDIPGILLSWTGIVESIMYGFEGLKPLDRWFSVLKDLLTAFKGLPKGHIGESVTCTMVRAIALRRPASVNMKEWEERICKITETTDDMPLKIKAMVNLACYLYSDGELQRLSIVIDSLKELMKRMIVPTLTQLTVSWIIVAHHNMMSLYDQCQEVISEGVEFSRKVGVTIMEYLLRGHGVMCSLKRGDFSKAKEHLLEMKISLNSAKPWEAGFYHYCTAWFSLYSNDLEEARTHSMRCLKFCEDTGNPWTLSLSHVLNSYISHAFGDPGQSLRHLAKAYSIGVQSRNEFTKFICLVTGAYFSSMKGNESRALENLRKGLKIGKEKGFVNLYMWTPGVMETVCARALEKSIEKPYVLDLIRKNFLVPDSSIVEIENWPWYLKIYTLGRFSVLKDGKPMKFSRKVQKMPLSLLKALIAFGGREVGEDQLTDALWPDASGDAGHSAFTTTLHRLRHITGSEQVIRFQDGKASLNPHYCWVDTWAFERTANQAQTTLKRVSEMKQQNESPRKKAYITEEIVTICKKAINLYNGHFLKGEEKFFWTTSYRERLRNKFLRLIVMLGNHLQQTGFWDHAVEYYLKGLEIDDLEEELYQNLMICYQKLGHQAKAIEIYQRCQTTMLSILGIEPSSKTRNIYNSISPAQMKAQ